MSGRRANTAGLKWREVRQRQKPVAEAKLEYNRALGEAWKAAGELSGLLMEEAWPAR